MTPGTPIPRLLAISDRRGVDPLAWFEQLAAALARLPPTAPGILAVLLREKDLDDRALFDLASAARHRLPEAIALFVHGRADIALAAGAQGVHSSSASGPDGCPDPPLTELRRAFGRHLHFGVSTHHLAEISDAERAGAAYVTFSPVFETPGKGPAVGVEALRQAVTATSLPVLGLGGIEAGRLAEVAATGAHGVAGIRCFQGASLDATLQATIQAWPSSVARAAAPGREQP